MLASYLSAAASGSELDLNNYLRQRVFGDAVFQTADPDAADIAGFATYLVNYRKGLAAQRSAIAVL